VNNFSDILNSLNEVTKQHEIFVPSLNLKTNFIGFTAKQQKEAIQCALEKENAGIYFSILTTEYIQNNLVEKNLNLLVSDKNYILTCLRALSLSKTYRTLGTETIDLSPILSNNIALPNNLKTAVLEDNDITVNVEIPSLIKDKIINLESKKIISDSQVNFLGNVYLNEIIKYIKSIKTPKTTINLDDLTFNQKTQIVEKLPIAISSKIVDYINNLKEFDKTLFTINNKNYSASIDPTLFTL